MIQAYIMAKMYIDARKLKEPKDIDLFQKKLFFAMPKIPLKKIPKHNEPQELNLNNWRFQLPPLYNRVHKYDKWNAKNETNKEQHDQVRNAERLNPDAIKNVNRANIEVDPEHPEYFDDDELNGFHDWNSSDDNGDDDDDDDSSDGANAGPTTVVVEAAVHVD